MMLITEMEYASGDMISHQTREPIKVNIFTLRVELQFDTALAT